MTFYNTPEKLAARPWAPTLNWVVIVSIYVFAALDLPPESDLRDATQ